MKSQCLCLAFFFFLMHADYTGQKTLCTVHGTHNHFIKKKKLKLGSTALFTHLKIILLQCFQFSAK